MKCVVNAGFVSHEGKRQVNEDVIFVEHRESRTGHVMTLAAVMDGLGGYEAGDQASQYVAIELKKWFLQYNEEVKWEDVDQQLTAILLQLNAVLVQYRNVQQVKLGTTCSLLFMYKGHYLIKHVGDCRIYKLQRMSGSMEQLTMDHTYVQQLVNEQKLSEQRARQHGKRNVLLQCIGMEEKLMIDTLKGKYKQQDVFILCSDGMYDLFEPTQFANDVKTLLTMYHDYNEAAAKLLLDVLNKPAVSDNLSIAFVQQQMTFLQRLHEKMNILMR